MKKLTYAVSIATLATSATVALAAGAANADVPDVAAPVADPHTVSVGIAPGVQYTGNTDDHSTLLSTPMGTVTSQNGAIQVADAQGQTVFGQGSFADAPKAATTTSASTAVTTHDAGAVAPVDDAAPHDPTADFNSALSQGATQFGLATGIGGLVGGVTGALIGCPFGAVTGGALSAITPPTTVLGAVGGCLLGASTVGAVGTIVGGAALGIPVGIASLVQGYNTLHADGDI